MPIQSSAPGPAAAPAETLVDPHAARCLAGFLRALLAVPASLYPVVYLGPLDGAEAVVGAFALLPEAASLRLRVVEAGRPPAGADVVVAGVDALAGWSAAECGAARLLVFGSHAPDALPEDHARRLGHPLAVDLRFDLPRPERSRISTAVERLLAGGTDALVVLVEEEGVAAAADTCALYGEAAGARVPRGAGGARGEAAGDLQLLAVRGAGPAAAEAAAAAGAWTSRGGRSCIVADPAGWDAVHQSAAWREVSPRFAVVRGGGISPSAAVPWPPAQVLWAGGAPASPFAPAAVMALPRGLPLVAALAHAEIGGGAGSLVVWSERNVAVIEFEQRAPGAVVVDVRLGGEASAGSREEALRALDGVRGWEGAEMAIVSHPPRGRGAVEETVTRVGFYLSRVDDERRAGDSTPGVEHPPLAREAVARVLVESGLWGQALALLRQPEDPAGESAVGHSLLLAWLLADTAPDEAVALLRHAAFALPARDDETRANVTLNALLLLVRTRQITADDAWSSLAPWIEALGGDWSRDPGRCAVAMELAARSGRTGAARAMARALAGAGTPSLVGVLAPVWQTVTGDER